MTTDIKWEAPTVSLTSYLTTTLNSLADETIDIGAAINNETNLVTHMDLEVTLGAINLSAQNGPALWVYLIESVDGGTDFDSLADADATDDLLPFDKVCAIISLRVKNETGTTTRVKSMIPIPPGRFKLGLRNKSGVAFASSGNILSYRTYNLNNV